MNKKIENKKSDEKSVEKWCYDTYFCSFKHWNKLIWKTFSFLPFFMKWYLSVCEKWGRREKHESIRISGYKGYKYYSLSGNWIKYTEASQLGGFSLLWTSTYIGNNNKFMYYIIYVLYKIPQTFISYSYYFN